MTDDDDEQTRREAHFNDQRASLRSDTSKTSSRPHSLSQSGDLNRTSSKADSDTRSGSRHRSATAPSRLEKEKRRKSQRTTALERERALRAANPASFTPWSDFEFLSAPPLDGAGQPSSHHSASVSRHPHAPRRPPLRSLSNPQRRSSPSMIAETGMTALPAVTENHDDTHASSNRPASMHDPSTFATRLYTISYLIFFAIWGTLARLGLQALTFYSGAPVVFSELWANVAGTFIIGFLAQDMQLFKEEWGNSRGKEMPLDSEPANLESERSPASHGKVKKTIPLYIGLATGFCGSFTSFSSFIRDVFLSLSNDLRSPVDHPYVGSPPSPGSTVPRHAGYSVMAVLATVLITVTLCYGALKAGTHLAALLDPIMPTLRFSFTRKVIDPLFVFLGLGSWIGAVILAIFAPHNVWRGDALFACVFAPAGCLLRYYVSLALNPTVPSFPMGTFAANILGTAVLGICYDLQRVRIGDIVGGSVVSCQVLQGIEDGFCGALTTVSTWMLEIDVLKRTHAYVYGSVSVVAGTGLLVVVMGSIRWSVGWAAIVCAT